MSTAMNHRKRSHKSNFRARAFNGAKRSVIKPSLRKDDYFSFIRFIRMLRQVMNRNREARRSEMQKAVEA